jgi:hypothetical protein
MPDASPKHIVKDKAVVCALAEWLQPNKERRSLPQWLNNTHFISSMAQFLCLGRSQASVFAAI